MKKENVDSLIGMDGVIDVDVCCAIGFIKFRGKYKNNSRIDLSNKLNPEFLV